MRIAWLRSHVSGSHVSGAADPCQRARARGWCWGWYYVCMDESSISIVSVVLKRKLPHRCRLSAFNKGPSGSLSPWLLPCLGQQASRPDSHHYTLNPLCMLCGHCRRLSPCRFFAAILGPAPVSTGATLACAPPSISSLLARHGRT